MRTWSRADTETLCGFCRRMIYREQPLLTIHPPEWSRGKVRCRDCADEPVPADLPSLPIRQVSAPLPLTRFTADMLPIDWKQNATGER